MWIKHLQLLTCCWQWQIRWDEWHVLNASSNSTRLDCVQQAGVRGTWNYLFRSISPVWEAWLVSEDTCEEPREPQSKCVKAHPCLAHALPPLLQAVLNALPPLLPDCGRMKGDCLSDSGNSQTLQRPGLCVINSWTSQGRKMHNSLWTSKTEAGGTALVVQCLRLRLPVQGVWVSPLVGELRSYVSLCWKTRT